MPAPSHPAAKLVQLGKAHPVGVFNDKGVGGGHIHAGLDNGGAHQHVNLVVQQLAPHFRELLFGHLPVANADAGLRHPLLDAGGRALDGGHIVVQVVHLAAPSQLPADGVRQNPHVVLQHISLHRVPVVGGLLNDGHVPNAGEGHVQGAGDGRG